MSIVKSLSVGNGDMFYIRRNPDNNEQDTDKRSNAGIHILWPIIANEDYKEALGEAKLGLCPNNICPIFRYKLDGGATVLWMGDLDTEFMEKIRGEIKIGTADILFAPHPGRETGSGPQHCLAETHAR